MGKAERLKGKITRYLCNKFVMPCGHQCVDGMAMKDLYNLVIANFRWFI